MTSKSATGDHQARRRGRGEGSITQRADGRWQARVDLGYVDGKRRAKYLYGKTRQEVARKLTAALRDQQQGLPLPNEQQTAGQFLSAWLENSVKPTVRPKTYISYEYICRVHLVPRLGKIRLARLTPDHVRACLRAVEDAGLSKRTAAYCRVVLRRALNVALKDGAIARNAAALTDPPRVERKEIQPLTPSQARAFLDVVSGHRLEALFTVAVGLGLREGEALGLMWDDVDFEARTLTVRRQLQRLDGQLQLVEPKTTKSRRTIIMPRVVADRLKAHRVRQVEERLAAGEVWTDTGLVFTSRHGTAIHPENLGRTMRPFLERTGCPPQRFHDLRHAAASLLFAQGLSAKAIMETLGHSQIATTADLYGHMYRELQQEVADRMDAILAVRS